jgi:hypothetical protein
MWSVGALAKTPSPTSSAKGFVCGAKWSRAYWVSGNLEQTTPFVALVASAAPF